MTSLLALKTYESLSQSGGYPKWLPTKQPVVDANNLAYKLGTGKVIIDMAKDSTSNFKGIIPLQFNLSYSRLRDKILEIETANPLNPIFRVAIYLSQVPPNLASIYTTNNDELFLLFFFMDKKGEVLSEAAYDFREKFYHKINLANTKPLFDRYKEPDQFYDQFERIKSNNTRFIHFPLDELTDFMQDAINADNNFTTIRLFPSEIDAYSNIIFQDAEYNSFKKTHKQFHFIAEAYNDVGQKILAFSYDINSLCPPECSDK